jgi:hypothetical protein
VVDDINIAKWVLLVLVCIEAAALLWAAIMCFCVNHEDKYLNFDEEDRREAQMSQMRAQQGSAYDSYAPLPQQPSRARQLNAILCTSFSRCALDPATMCLWVRSALFGKMR